VPRSAVLFWILWSVDGKFIKAVLALHLKLDEIIIALDNARNEFVAVEELPEHELEQKEEEEKAKAGIIREDSVP